jgi:hypothetical protein
MAYYDDVSTLGEARERYFADNGFSARYDERWVKLRLGGRAVPVLPNTRARVAAARIHDLHHVTTGYDTTWTGEGEIGAWELASGCGPYLAAWMLNLSAFGVGLLISPGRMLRAFVRGRRTRNFYPEGYDAARLTQTVGDLRRNLGLDQAVAAASFSDVLHFSAWMLLCVAYALAGSLALPLLALAMWKMPREGHSVPPQATDDRTAHA